MSSIFLSFFLSTFSKVQTSEKTVVVVVVVDTPTFSLSLSLSPRL